MLILRALPYLLQFIILNCLASGELVQTSKCKSIQIAKSYKAIGQMHLGRRQDFFSSTSGTVDFVSPKQGQIVEAGEIIFSVDEVLADSIKQQAMDNYQEAVAKLKSNHVLYVKKLISDDIYQKSKLKVASAKTALAEAKKKYNSMIFIAPFKGRLGVIEYVPGNYITGPAANFLFSIVDELGPKLINFYLPGSLINKLNQNPKINLNFDGNILEGKIISKSTSLSKSNGSFLVKALINTESFIPDNAVLMGEFIFDEHKALVVPEQSVIKNNQGGFLYIIKQNENKEFVSHKIIIKTGIRKEGFVEVFSDQLTENTVIVSGGMMKLSDGAKIQISNDDN